jgi:hypothetical protein
VTVREITKSPNAIGLYLRAALPLVPGANHVPGLPVPKGSGLPDLELVMRDVVADDARVSAYNQVCGSADGDKLPPLYPHMLAFGLQMTLMTDGSFPFAAIGLVHIENRLTVHRPIGRGEAMTLRVFPAGLARHPKGRQFSVVTEARVGDELVWEETSTMLRRGSANDVERGAQPARGVKTADDAVWHVPGDIGRRYAGVSGDRNPIHLYDVTAKLLGFPRAIAHGMWTKARCLAELEGRLAEAFVADVAFRRPVLLPAEVHFGAQDDADAILFGIHDPKGRSHLDGVVTAS